MGETPMDSAVLTATIKSLKLLDTMNKRQETMAKEIGNIKLSQQSQTSELEALIAKSNNDELNEITERLTNISNAVAKIDLNSLQNKIETHVTNKTDSVMSLVTNTVEQHEINSVERHESVLTSIEKSNKSENIETIMKLIDGLKNIQKNILQLATRVETLSLNVNNGREDTLSLAETIRESNTRVMSMDMRMASLTAEEGATETDDIESTIAFLERFSPEGTESIDK